MRRRTILSAIVGVAALTLPRARPLAATDRVERAAGTLATTVNSAANVAESTMKELKSRHLFSISIDLHGIWELGMTPAGERRVDTCGRRAIQRRAVAR